MRLIGGQEKNNWKIEGEEKGTIVGQKDEKRGEKEDNMGKRGREVEEDKRGTQKGPQ